MDKNKQELLPVSVDSVTVEHNINGFFRAYTFYKVTDIELKFISKHNPKRLIIRKKNTHSIKSEDIEEITRLFKIIIKKTGYEIRSQ